MSGRLSLRLAGTPGRLVGQLAALIRPLDAPVPMFPMLVVETVTTRPWSSATFEGERHRLELRLHGAAEQIGEALDRLMTNLPDAEFTLPGQFLAEAKLVSVAVDPDPLAVALALVVEVLTVVD